MWAAVGLAAFLWMGYEDQGRSFVILLGALITVSSAATHLLRGGFSSAIPRPARVMKLAWTGLLVGGGTGLVAALLMLVKVSIHRHPGAEFTGNDVLWSLRQVPIWGLVGTLAGAVLGLLWPPPRTS
jgi:hypothetical protein